MQRFTTTGWSGPSIVHADGWRIEGCPVNGPSVAARGAVAVVAWYTAAREEARVWLARSEDGGVTFGDPVRIDEGHPLGRVDVALAPEREDRRHPAFSKLFVESRYVPELGGILSTRRPRSPGEKPPVLLHALVVPTALEATIGHDASRETFLGRGGSRRRPAGLRGASPGLAGTTGLTLDPAVAMSASFTLAPHGVAELA